ncbi:MAG: hypothetical protein ACHQ4H_01645 [Ktedonobacterales bacterium]
MPIRTTGAGADGQRPTAPVAPQRMLDDDQLRRVYRFMYRHVGNREEAEDLTTRACAQAIRMPTAPDGHMPASLEERLCQSMRAVVSEHLRWFYHASDDAPDGGSTG